MKNYTTDCFYRASALMIVTGLEPEKIEPMTTEYGPRATVHFKNVDYNVIKDLEGGRVKVDPLKFKQTILKLKKMIFPVLQKYEKEN